MARLGGLSLSGRAVSEPLRDPFEFHNLLDRLYRKSWWVYSKPRFGGPEPVLNYLARYTHRVALPITVWSAWTAIR